MKISDAFNQHPTQAPEIAPLEPLKGPIKWIYAKQNFTLISDTSDDARTKWIAARLSYEWRKVVIFNQLKATVIGAVPACKKPSVAKDNERDKYIHQLTADWISLENQLVHYALRFHQPLCENEQEKEARILREAEIVKSEDGHKKLETIAIQDRLNGFDIIQKMMEISNATRAAEALNNFKDRELEERAELLALEKYGAVRPSESSAAGRVEKKPSAPRKRGQKGKKHVQPEGDLQG